MIDRFRRDDLVFNKHRRRHRPAVQQIEAHADQIVAITLGKISDRSYQPGVGLPEFGTAFRRCVMTHHDATVGSPGLLESAQSTQRAGIVDGSDDNAPRVRGTQMLSYGFEALVETAVAIDVHDGAVAQV